MRKRSFAIAIFAALLVVSAALATGGTPLLRHVTFSAVGIVSTDTHLNADRIKFQTKDPVDVVMQQITYDAGAFSGWHSHPGFVLVVVKSGTLRVYHADCSYRQITTGDTLLETGDDVIGLRNESGAPAVIAATYVVPHVDGPAPVIRIDAPNPGCPFE